MNRFVSNGNGTPVFMLRERILASSCRNGNVRRQCGNRSSLSRNPHHLVAMSITRNLFSSSSSLSSSTSFASSSSYFPHPAVSSSPFHLKSTHSSHHHNHHHDSHLPLSEVPLSSSHSSPIHAPPFPISRNLFNYLSDSDSNGAQAGNDNPVDGNNNSNNNNGNSNPMSNNDDNNDDPIDDDNDDDVDDDEDNGEDEDAIEENNRQQQAAALVDEFADPTNNNNNNNNTNDTSSSDDTNTANSNNSTPSSSNNGSKRHNNITIVPMFAPTPLAARVSLQAFPRPSKLIAVPHEEVWFPGRFFEKNISHPGLRKVLHDPVPGKRPYLALFRMKTKEDLEKEKMAAKPQENPSNDNTAASDPSTSTNASAPSSSSSSSTPSSSSSSSSSKTPLLPQLGVQSRMIVDPNVIHPMGVMVRYTIVGDYTSYTRVQFVVIRRVLMKGADFRNGEMRASVEHIDEEELSEMKEKNVEHAEHVKAQLGHLQSSWNEYQKSDSFRLVQGRRDHILQTNISALEIPGHYADFIAGNMDRSDSMSDLQAVLDAVDVHHRLSLVIDLLEKEKHVAQIRDNINKMVNEKHSQKQNELILKEQLKVIQKQLGVGKGAEKENLLERYRERLKTRTVPQEAQKVIDEEMLKFQSLEPESMEYNITKNYLEWLTILPWGVYTKDEFDIQHAETVLNQDHYGLEDVKNRILEFIAVAQLLKTIPQGKIICLVGPPGVGKTSIGKSIARALNRKFYRMAVGGTDDVSEIKGHRRTYVGSLPGKLIQGLKRVECANPVILIDEIDKLGRGWRGDPAAALLEVLDPEQNQGFTDHYLDVPVDLSKVLFICTANSDDTIPGPLKDRMEFIHLSGYVWKEKLDIAKNYLIPTIRKRTGVSDQQLIVSDDAVSDLIRWYCREPGVRNLSKHIEKLFNKAALKIARNVTAVPSDAANAQPQASTQTAATMTPTTVGGESSSSSAIPKEASSAPQPSVTSVIPNSSQSSTTSTPSSTVIPETQQEQTQQAIGSSPISPLSLPLVVTSENLSEFAGKRVFNSDRLYESMPVGVSMGLAWNPMGGTMIFIEATIAETFGKKTPVVPKKTRGRPASKDKDDGPVLPTDDPHASSSHMEEDGGHGELFTTGQLGDVMKESSLIAYTVAKQCLALIDPSNRFFSRHRVHLHVPEGATPKDGPSAGITMVTCLLSLAMNRAARPNVAMTGELALTGKVLPIGGVKEKILAARRAQVTDLIFPFDNRKDVDELQPFVKEGITFHFVKQYEEVRRIIFPLPSDTEAQVQVSNSSVIPKRVPRRGSKKNNNNNNSGTMPSVDIIIPPQAPTSSI